MRLLVAVCAVALCLMTSSARPHGKKRGSHERGPRPRPLPRMCSLTNQTSDVTNTTECREGFHCGSESVDFLIGSAQYAASFCKPGAPEELPEGAPERVLLMNGTDRLAMFLLGRACSVNNGAAVVRQKPCHGGLTCSLGEVKVEMGDVLLTATYCQAEDAEDEVDWLDVFNGGRGSVGDSSEESEEDEDEDEQSSESDESSSEQSSESDESSSEQSSELRGRGRRPRRDADSGEEKTRGPCNITTADGEVIEDSTCPEESACSVGPVLADNNGQAISIFFCERPAKSSESSDSSEEDVTTATPEESFDHIASKMFCNACELSKNGRKVGNSSCGAEQTCSAGPISTDVSGGTSVSATFCSGTEEDFSLLEALQCAKKGGKSGEDLGRGGKGKGKEGKGKGRGGKGRKSGRRS